MIDGLERTISVLEDIDRTPYLKELCRRYSVYDFDDKFRVIRDPISGLIHENYDAGYFLSNYPDVLSLYGLDGGQMDQLNVDELPYLATLACLTCTFGVTTFARDFSLHAALQMGLCCGCSAI